MTPQLHVVRSVLRLIWADLILTISLTVLLRVNPFGWSNAREMYEIAILGITGFMVLGLAVVMVPLLQPTQGEPMIPANLTKAEELGLIWRRDKSLSCLHGQALYEFCPRCADEVHPDDLDLMDKHRQAEDCRRRRQEARVTFAGIRAGTVVDALECFNVEQLIRIKDGVDRELDRRYRLRRPN